ncbi:MAG: YcnI family protein, partial [Bradyrhizobium sp.]
PGWQLDLVKAKYDKPYAMVHGSVTEGVKEVAWSGNLPNDYYDEFVLSVYLTDDLTPGKTVYFPVVQECEDGVHRWIEIPQEGKSAADTKEPAPGLKLLPKP